MRSTLYLITLIILTLTSTPFALTAETATPVAHLQWSPSTPPSGPKAPDVVAFRGAYGLDFISADGTRVDLSSATSALDFNFTGSLTISIVCRLTKQPSSQGAFVSKYRLATGGRCYELGIQSSGSIYWVVSPDGEFSGSAKQLDTTFQMQTGIDYAVTAVYDAAKRMSIYVNGGFILGSSSSIPNHINSNTQIPMLGARSDGNARIDAIIGDVWFYEQALDSTQVAAWAQQVGLTDAPPPDPIPFEDALYPPGHVLPPVRAITQGPGYHWFSYYDILEFDPTNRFVLGMQVDFEDRSPAADDVVTLGMIDLQDNDKWTTIGTTTAWCWQQGCRLQWRPCSQSEVVWNDRDGDHYITRVKNVWTGAERTFPHPIYHIHPNGKIALGVDFRRIGWARSGYGYNGIADPNRNIASPTDSGIYTLDLDTGEYNFLFSIADIAAIPYSGQGANDVHYFNHIEWNTDGSRFLFLDRGWGAGRMLTANADGSDIRFVCYSPSHYHWRDPEHIIVWSGSYKLFKDDNSGEYEVLWNAPNGHETYFRDGEWILSDTYPMGSERLQHSYLFHAPTKKIIPLGHFNSPSSYGGERRCDTHPRISPDGTQVVIDSPHGGNGRQLYLIDISGFVGDATGARFGSVDLFRFSLDWHKESQFVPSSDLNQDGAVGFDDLLDLIKLAGENDNREE
jgi:Concanavalin A-like lectin/glucanases superfamily